MSPSRRCHLCVRLAVLAASLTFAGGAAAAEADRAAPAELFSINAETAGSLQSSGLSGSIKKVDGANRLRLQVTGDAPAAVTFAAPGGKWDLSKVDAVALSVRNAGAEPITVRARAENPTANKYDDASHSAVSLVPGEEQTLRVRLSRRPDDPGYDVFQPFYMYFKKINVRYNTVDPSEIAKLIVSIDKPGRGQVIEVSGVRTEGTGEPAPVKFLPFVDEYGQYIHSDWVGKIYTDADFAKQRKLEEEERVRWPGPKDWNKFGGWAGGPQLKKTGFFHVTKRDGKWWLVDPDGRLFWSYGPTGVGFGGDVSPVTDRENWFRNLPSRDSAEWGQYFREGRGATYCYYQDKSWVGYDVAAANLKRKYGDDVEKTVTALSHDRMRSWGFNTLGNWSDGRVYAMKRTPYTVAIHYGSPKMHYRMPDIYHKDWEPSLRKRLMDEKAKTAGDAWNIGYFVDNELWWGWRPRAAAVAEEALKNPADAACKVKIVDQLTKKYKTIAALNKAWETSFASWDALRENRDAPNMKNAATVEDCGDFGMAFTEKYYSTVRDAVKKAAPNQMYLGSRFHGHIDQTIMKLAAKYSDLISYNIYDNPPEKRVNQYTNLDLPFMSTEWGIGSDPMQTPFRGNDEQSPDPTERSGEMIQYAEHAIRHPNMVGAHFFQYRDQPISGRPDGEATLRGFVNIVDTPNFELVQANRRLAYDMYRTRAGAK